MLCLNAYNPVSDVAEGPFCVQIGIVSPQSIRMNNILYNKTTVLLIVKKQKGDNLQEKRAELIKIEAIFLLNMLEDHI